MIVGARGLKDPQWMGTTDPYCVCEVPGKPQTKFETKAAANTPNPDWDQEYEVLNYETGEPLLFHVMDKGKWPLSDELLGKALMRSSQFVPDGFFGEVPLT